MRQREFPAALRRDRQGRPRRLAEVPVEHADTAAADHVRRPGDRIGGDRNAGSQAPRAGRCRRCRCGSERRRRRHWHRPRPAARRTGHRQNAPRGKAAASSARAGPSPTTTFEPGRSRARKAAMFFSGATRPTNRKTGRGRSRAPLFGRGWNIALSTPRDQRMRLRKPRALQFAFERRRRHHAADAGIVEPPQHGIGERRRHRQASAQIFGKARVKAGREAPPGPPAPAPRRQPDRPLGGDMDVIGTAGGDEPPDRAGAGEGEPDLGIGRDREWSGSAPASASSP